MLSHTNQPVNVFSKHKIPNNQNLAALIWEKWTKAKTIKWGPLLSLLHLFPIPMVEQQPGHPGLLRVEPVP